MSGATGPTVTVDLPAATIRVVADDLPGPDDWELKPGQKVLAIPVRVNHRDLFDLVLPDDNRYWTTVTPEQLGRYTTPEDSPR